jgi:beta-galactosidase
VAGRRASQNFPADILRWEVELVSGTNHLRAIATGYGVTVTDENRTDLPDGDVGAPAKLKLSEKGRKNNLVTVQAKLFDAHGVLCLDSAKAVRFSLVGAGRLLDSLGTTRGSSEVQLANRRAQISFVRDGGCRIEATPEGLSAALLNVCFAHFLQEMEHVIFS